MRGHKVDTRLDATVCGGVQVGGTCDTFLHLVEHMLVAFYKTTDGVAVLAVPFSPASPRRERAYLIQSARIPRLGNEFGLAKYRVVRQGFQKRRIRHRIAVLVASEDGCKVKPESIHVIIRHPITQRIHNHVAHVGVVAVQGVATAGEVEIITILREHIVRLVVDATVRNVRAVFVALGGVVEHNVKYNFDALGVETLDEVFQLIYLHGILARGSVRRLRCKKSHVGISPGVVQCMTIGRGARIFKLVKLVYRHEFHTVDTEFFEVRDFFRNTCKSARMLHTRLGATGEIAHVHLVYHEVVDGSFERKVVFPIKIVKHYTRTVLVIVDPIRLLAPHVASGDEFGVRIHEDFGLVETVSLPRVKRAVHAVAVLDVFVVEVKNHHRKDVAKPELLEKRNLQEGRLVVVVKQHESTIGGITRINRKIHRIAHHGRTERIRTTSTEFIAAKLVCRE